MAKSEQLTREQRGRSVSVAGLEITPVERVSIRVFELAGSLAGRAEKRPIALLLRAGDREWRVELPGFAPRPDTDSNPDADSPLPGGEPS